MAGGRCQYHPDRPGLGVCVECRKTICRECTTQFDGINRCATCVARLQAEVARLAERVEWTAGSVALSAFSLLLIAAIVFGALRVVD